MIGFSAFIGRFHPLLVHLPIGILVFALALELLSRRSGFKKTRFAVRPALLLGSLSSIISAITGYFLSQEGGYNDRILMIHQYLGIATAISSTGLFFLWDSKLMLPADKQRRRQLRLLLLILLMLILGITGHMGGSLTHGEDYLSFTSIVNDDEQSAVKLDSIRNVDEAVLYADVIQPILETRCYSCHSSKKQKGQLRLDGKAHILKGGKNGLVLREGPPDSSALFHRIVLPIQHEDHMPPEEKPQLSSAEVDLLNAWIADGASFEKKVSAYADQQRITGFVKFLQAAGKTEQQKIEYEPVAPAEEKDIAALRALGVLIMPVGKDDNHLTVNFVNTRTVGDSVFQMLLPLKKQIVALSIGGLTFSEEAPKAIAQLTALRNLNLSKTNISDAGLRQLKGLSELVYLNLTSTSISDAGLPSDGQFPRLQEIYVYQTRVTRDGIRRLLESSKLLHADTGGYELPVLVTDTLVYKRVMN